MKSVQKPMFNSPNTTTDTPEAAEEYKFEPIQGYPMLHWKGKRPYRSTQYYPAQPKETHGDPVDGWFNRIYWGDNLQVMSHLLREFRGKVQLVYIDPPFDSKADYKKKVSLRGQRATNDLNTFEEKQYTDIWTNDEYLQFIYERLILIRELLADDGCIYFHCDWHKSHLLRCIIDEIFGYNNFLSEIIWQRTASHNDPGRYGSIHDSIFFYKKNSQYIWNSPKVPQSQNYIDQFFVYAESPNKEIVRLKKGEKCPEGWRRFRLGNFASPNPRPNLRYEYKGYKPPANGWKVSCEKMTKMDEQNRLFFPKSKEGRIQPKSYLDEVADGKPAPDLWTDMLAIQSQSSERENYPTQKPEALLERIIKASSNPGDLVFDCFMGSGTTQAVAMKLGRKFIGADINLGAVQITTKRLLSVADDLKQQQAQISLDADENAPENLYTGFSVYNVNHYDVFRNPVQAKELLIEAFAVQPLPGHTMYDGQKDGRMVRIMPVNRIATKADLNELLSNLDYKAFEKRKAEHPKTPVEKITLICMGHEPDLGAILEKEAGYDLDVDVVDILRDKANLEFKRDSEARIAANNGNLIVENFYPMNLLQKLSLFKENVEDWRELVESVMIDWTYDGTVFRPALTDIPGKNELVRGVYPLPKRTSTIRVKITDLLSESWEGEVMRG